MRDIVITAMILGLVPLIWKRPWIGVLAWLWVSVMNPHRFAYGFANSFPFAAIIVVVTVASMLKSRRDVKLPFNATTALFIMLPLWMCITTFFAFEPALAYVRWKEVMKIFFFIVIGASLINSRKQVDWVIWVIVFSVGFFGVKGGLFTILTGGTYRVYGPPGDGFMSDNNAIPVALCMIIPLMLYLRSVSSSKWVKRGLLVSSVLCGLATLGSQSRGALLAVLAMAAFLWFKSNKKILSGVVAAVLIPLGIGFMPDSWTSRMRTIETYDQDTSALGRLNSWKAAINIANDRPLIGGGFEYYTPSVFAKYAPDPLAVHSAHSIYFQMLGEHGYVGLIMFLALGIVAWTTANRVIRLSRDSPENAWAGTLGQAVQVSLIGYAVGGLFVNIAYWEIQYYEIIGLMVVSALLKPPKPSPALI
jgi:putative inorganic carbon (hco3(-)) transporter